MDKNNKIALVLTKVFLLKKLDKYKILCYNIHSKRGDTMQDITNHIDTILKTNETLSNDFGRFSKVYLMTTENIKGFLEQYDLTNKDILTVAGSGDQMLNAYLMGARNVTCFDINPLAFYQVKLKKAAVCTLSYEEFVAFFFQEYGKFLDINLFDKISKELDSETTHFFENLYYKYDPKEIFKKIYYHFTPKFEKMVRLNTYLEKENYQKLASILKEKEITFIESDVTKLREHLKNEFFYMILLSNINDSIEDIWSSDSLKNYKRLIHSFSKNLVLDGTIQVGYIYDYYGVRQDKLFSKKHERQKIFTSDEFHTTFVESYLFYGDRDAIITFQKTKKKAS